MEFDKNCKHELIVMEGRLLDLDGNVVSKEVKCKKCGGIGHQLIK